VFRLSFLPLLRSAVGFGRSFIGSSPSYTAGLPDCSRFALTSSGGLLLVRLAERQDGYVRLAVCDPIAGTCNVLPPLVCHGFYGLKNYAILTDADLCSSGEQQPRPPLPGLSKIFKVIAIFTNRGLSKIYTFSSSDRNWGTMGHDRQAR
jgi:hypothetical protein